MTSLRELITRFPSEGTLEWIGVRPARRAPVRPLEAAVLHTGCGIEGDRHADEGRRSKRQVTLIQAEHLQVVAQLLGLGEVRPERLRRNLVVRGVNLDALRGARFRVGQAVLEGIEPCHPCSRMEEALGYGGYNAMRGHGGLIARVIEGATIRLGDPVAYRPSHD